MKELFVVNIICIDKDKDQKNREKMSRFICEIHTFNKRNLRGGLMSFEGGNRLAEINIISN